MKTWPGQIPQPQQHRHFERIQRIRDWCDGRLAGEPFLVVIL